MVVVPLRKKMKGSYLFFKDQKTLLKLGLPSKWPKKKSCDFLNGQKFKQFFTLTTSFGLYKIGGF